MSNYQLSVKEKGRTVLPIGLQRACGFAPGAKLVARPLGRGSFVVETPEAVLERIWAGIPQNTITDGVGDLVRWRQISEAERWARLAPSEFPPEEILAQRANQLLSSLGL